MDMEMKMDSHSSILEAVEEYILCVNLHRDTIHAFSTINQLLEVANIDERDPNGCTALMLLTEDEDFAEMVQKFVDAGAGLDIKNKDGATALMRASDENCAEIVEILIKAGAGLDIKDKDGATALMRASDENCAEIVEILIKAGAGLDIIDGDGKTALMRATCRGYRKIAEILIKAGADLEIKDGDGKTALKQAIDFDRLIDIAKLLIDAGANGDWRRWMRDRRPLHF